jgi:hypothetical protein
MNCGTVMPPDDAAGESQQFCFENRSGRTSMFARVEEFMEMFLCLKKS